jgi:hypothetical protein
MAMVLQTREGGSRWWWVDGEAMNVATRTGVARDSHREGLTRRRVAGTREVAMGGSRVKGRPRTRTGREMAKSPIGTALRVYK